MRIYPIKLYTSIAILSRMYYNIITITFIMEQKMELLQLKYFCHAAECENFSQTANKFSVPQSAVSQSIKRLEKELNIELFDRNKNKIELNENGFAFLNHISVALNEIEQGCEEIKRKNAEAHGDIKILIKNNRRYITDCIAEFKKKYPYISFTISHESVAKKESDFDFVISDAQPNGNFQKTELIKEKIVLSVSKDNPLSSKSIINAKDISEEKFISMPKSSNLFKYFNEFCKKQNINPSITIFCDDPFYIRKYTAINLGVSLFPEFSWKGLAYDETVNIPIENAPIRTSYLFYNASFANNNAPKLFFDFLMLKSSKNV